MALGSCRECGKEISTLAQTCPSCGVPHPAKRNSRSSIIPILLITGSVFFLYQAFSSIINKQPHTPAPQTATQPVTETPPTPSRTRGWENLSEADLRTVLADEYRVMISASKPNLNFIKARISKAGKGYALYAVHDFFSQYTLSAGTEAHLISTWIDLNRDWLTKAKITRVGVWGTGEYSSGSWFDLATSK